MFHPPEPGYYKDGAFGIRLETIVGVKVMDTPVSYKHLIYYGYTLYSGFIFFFFFFFWGGGGGGGVKQNYSHDILLSTK